MSVLHLSRPGNNVSRRLTENPSRRGDCDGFFVVIKTGILAGTIRKIFHFSFFISHLSSQNLVANSRRDLIASVELSDVVDDK